MLEQIRFATILIQQKLACLLASVPFVFCADILDSLQCLQAPDTSPNRTLNCAFFASASNENRQAPISPKQTNKIKLELDIIYGRQKIRTTLYINHDPHTSHALTELPLLWPLLWTESAFDKDVHLYNSYHFISYSLSNGIKLSNSLEILPPSACRAFLMNCPTFLIPEKCTWSECLDQNSCESTGAYEAVCRHRPLKYANI